MLGQRRYERVAFYCPVQLTVLPNGPAVAGNTFDISIAGVGIITDLYLERGQTVCVRFHLNNGADTTIEEDVMGRVAYSRADENCTRVGIEFLEVIRDATQLTLAHVLENL